MLNDEYVKEASESPFFDPPPIVRLSEFNSRLWEMYQLTNTNFARQQPNYFVFAIQTYFSDLDALEAQYLCTALAELEFIVKQNKLKKMETEEHKVKVKQLVSGV